MAMVMRMLDPTFRRALAVISYNDNDHPRLSKHNIFHYEYTFTGDIRQSAMER
jgi:hypothetical protein